MNEQEARSLLLVRAIEQEDRQCDLLTAEDRKRADVHASEATRGSEADLGYVVRRSEFAAQRLSVRHPTVQAIVTRSRWPRRLVWVLPLAALIAGMLANELGNSGRLNLLAPPLLVTLAWNLAAYMGLILHALQSGTASRKTPAFIMQLLKTLRSSPPVERETVLARALARFSSDWESASRPLTFARIACTLHLSAAAFALGLISGIYLRALTTEYRAVWESTFLEAETVHAILAFVLAPASSLIGVSIPSAEQISSLRSVGTREAGGDAGYWIHLYTTTALIFVVAPRLILAAFAAFKARTLSRVFPAPGREDFYVRRLLRNSSGSPPSVRVTPYAYNPDVAARERLENLLREAVGERMRVHFDEAVDYGGEEAWLRRSSFRPDDDFHFLLFNLSSTPENENHGALVKGLGERLTREGNGARVGVVVDESVFRRRFAGQAHLDARLRTRADTWDEAVGKAGLVPLVTDLSAEDPGDARRLEAVIADVRLSSD